MNFLCFDLNDDDAFDRVMNLNLRDIYLLKILMIWWAMRFVILVRHAFAHLILTFWRYSILTAEINILNFFWKFWFLFRRVFIRWFSWLLRQLFHCSRSLRESRFNEDENVFRYSWTSWRDFSACIDLTAVWERIKRELQFDCRRKWLRNDRRDTFSWFSALNLIRLILSSTLCNSWTSSNRLVFSRSSLTSCCRSKRREWWSKHWFRRLCRFRR